MLSVQTALSQVIMTRYHTGPQKMVYNDSFYTFNYRAYNMLYRMV